MMSAVRKLGATVVSFGFGRQRQLRVELRGWDCSLLEHGTVRVVALCCGWSVASESATTWWCKSWKEDETKPGRLADPKFPYRCQSIIHVVLVPFYEIIKVGIWRNSVTPAGDPDFQVLISHLHALSQVDPSCQIDDRATCTNEEK